MSFNSIHFLIFFPVITALYFFLPHRFRWALLLAASCYFYMSFVPYYILILGFTIVVDYYAGILIEQSEGRKRKLYLFVTLFVNIGILFVFKYFNFFNANLKGLADALHWNYSIESLSLILPIGLSFYTFQAMSYTIDVYRGAQKAERNLGILALFVTFYPQLVAGPIERSQNLLPQFYVEHRFDYERVTNGLKLMAWGFFKKIVIADRLAVVVNQIYNDPTKHTGVPLIIATYFFAFQIYCDFSGYTDIARGASRVMGFELMKNFNRPYAAKSISEFWIRWHISLSTWFKDYLFFPLARWHAAAKRQSASGLLKLNPLVSLIHKQGVYFDIFVVFLISGLWHGANWTFLIWGALHAAYLMFALATKGWRTRVLQPTGLLEKPVLLNLFRTVIVFNLVAFAWIFFRANSLSDAVYIVSNLMTGISLTESFGENLATRLSMSRTDLALSIGLIVILEVAQYLHELFGLKSLLESRPFWFRWALYYAMIAAILFIGEYQANQFIYFQF